MRKTRGYIWILSLCLIVLAGWTFSVNAKEKKTVRVGIFDYQAFYGKDLEGNPYGYGFEYLDTLSQYGDFDFKYVYGSWKECLNWLDEGKIDMLDSGQKSNGREEKFLFSSYSTGTSYGELYVRADDLSISYGDFKAMDGLTVGMLEENSRNTTFKNYAEKNGFSFQTKMFETAEELSNALQDGAVDAIVSSNLRHGKNERALTRFSPAPFFLMFNSEQEQLQKEIDDTIENILIDYPDFNAQLNEKYFSDDTSFSSFTKEEQRFSQDAAPLKVIFNDGWIPFSYYDNQEARGINVDILDLIAQKTGLTFEYVHGDPDRTPSDMVSSGDADLFLGYQKNIQNTGVTLNATDSFLSVPFALIGKTATIPEDSVFAVPQNNEEMITILTEQFQGASIIVLDSFDACHEAVRNGQADFTMDNIYTATDYITAETGKDLEIPFVFPVRSYYSLGFGDDLDPMLQRILNKGINSITQTEITSVITKYTVKQPLDLSLTSFIGKHRDTLFLSTALFLMLLACIIYFVCKLHKKKQQSLWTTTYIDELTGIGNFDLFQKEARELLDKNSATKYMVCKFDIENFKLLNEIYGFEQGDWIIQTLAKELCCAAVSSQEVCARISGDDFIILKSYIHSEDNLAVLKYHEGQFYKAVGYEFNPLIKLKFGVYYIEDNKESISSIMEKANYAHSICKANPGTAMYIYDETAKQGAIEEKKIEAKMDAALEEGQFILYLQPKYHLSNETLAGAEALVRWKTAETSEIIYPNKFIPLFEKNGFIVKLDMYMLEQSCKLIRSWIDSGKTPTTISINFSRLHLLNPQFTMEICGIVDSYDIPRSYIEIELTESAMFDNEEAMSNVLESLHEEGFTLSMDDFGTGYSSLGLLKNLPVDVIKIDRSFFIDSKFKTRARTVIENVMQMAKRLEIHTVAEGVENQEHIDMLKEMGCEIVQGYYYSRPVPAEEFPIDDAILHKEKVPKELILRADELGDLKVGRPNSGDTVSAFSYRLFQVSLRKVLSDMYGEGEMVSLLRTAGKMAGGMFAREYLNTGLELQDFIIELSNKLAELKIGKLKVEQMDLESGTGIITISDDIDCSGMGDCNQTLCQYDEGFIAGILKEFTQKSYTVLETDCWGNGADLCRFEITIR